MNRTHTHTFGERIALDTVDAFADELETVFASAEIDRIVYDLENVRICDLYGVQFLIQSQRKARHRNKPLILFRASAQIQKMFHDAGLFHACTFEDSLESETRE